MVGKEWWGKYGEGSMVGEVGWGSLVGKVSILILPVVEKFFVSLMQDFILFRYFFSVLFLHNRQGTSEFPVYAFQEGQYRFKRANTDSGGPILIQEGQYKTVCAF